MSCQPSSSNTPTRRRRPPRSPGCRSRASQAAVAFLLTTAVSLQGVAATTGGSSCPSTSMCISAISNGTKVTYQMRSTLGFQQLGWMAVGFGTQMPNSPMVITWPNADGSITLSQREATGHIMPEVVPNPAQTATIEYTNTILAMNTTSIAFDYPLPSNLQAVDMIFAWATVRPPSSAVDATLEQHTESGPFVMDLTQAVNALPTGSFSTAVVGTSTVIRQTPTGIPVSTTATSTFVGAEGLTPQEVQIRTHGILMSVGFLIILPTGIFIARFSRTVPFLKGKWFTAHWFVQLVLGGPIIFTGWAIGYRQVAADGPYHFNDNHRRIGLVLLVLYLVQICWGATIHFFKPKGFRPPASKALPSDADADAEKVGEAGARGPVALMSPNKLATSGDVHSGTSETANETPSTVPTRKLDPLSPEYHPSSLPNCNRYPAVCARPIQNYLHAVMGLVIIGLAFHNVREGYHNEWEYTFGLKYSPFLEHINGWWIAWVIIIPAIYVIGLTLLPRQWRQEDEAFRRARADPPRPQPAEAS